MCPSLQKQNCVVVATYICMHEHEHDHILVLASNTTSNAHVVIYWVVADGVIGVGNENVRISAHCFFPSSFL